MNPMILLRAVPSSPYQSPTDEATPASTSPRSSAGARPAPSSDERLSASSRRTNDHSEHVLLPVVVPEGELVKVQGQVILGDLMERAHYAALQETPERVNMRSVDFAADVFAAAVVNGLVRREVIVEREIAGVVVRSDHRNAVRDRLADAAAN